MSAPHALVDAPALPRDVAVRDLAVVNPHADDRRADVAIAGAGWALVTAAGLMLVWFAVEVFSSTGVIP